MAKLRVACASLSQRIYAGYATKDGTRLKEPRHDVTSDVLRAVVDKIGIGHQVDIVSGDEVVCTIKIIAPRGSAEGVAPVIEEDGSGRNPK